VADPVVKTVVDRLEAPAVLNRLPNRQPAALTSLVRAALTSLVRARGSRLQESRW
jgi:hypothetical protein